MHDWRGNLFPALFFVKGILGVGAYGTRWWMVYPRSLIADNATGRV